MLITEKHGFLRILKDLITDNNCVNEAIVYITTIAFLISVFPVHVFSYVYASTQNGYASLNVSLFRLIPLFNFNSKKPVKIKGNDGEDKADFPKPKYPSHYLDLYNKLCLTKIVQVADFGMQNQNNAYALLAQHVATQGLYSFVKINGGKTKLRNYVVVNNEHGYINYYLKLVGVINLMVLLRLVIIYFWSILNER